MRLADGQLRTMTEEDLPMVLRWRNSDQVRPFMISESLISMEEHIKWFKAIDRKKEIHNIFEFRGNPCGLVSFKDIDHINQQCSWGFYLGETGLPRGTGLLMGCIALNMAFENMKMAIINSVVIASNKRSIDFHKKLGFIQTHYKDKQIFRDGEMQGIIFFQLTGNRWYGIRDSIGIQ